jgi:hypothetical protein
MSMTLSTVETKVEQLLAVLDQDIRHLETTLSQLEALRSHLIKHDDAALSGLLDEIRGRTQEYAATQQMRQTIRAELANALGSDSRHLTLSGLQSSLPEPQRAAVTTRQQRLRSLIVELNRQYTLTSLLVADCSRFNRMLLRTFLGLRGPAGVVYSPSGATRQQTETAMMNLQL